MFSLNNPDFFPFSFIFPPSVFSPLIISPRLLVSFPLLSGRDCDPGSAHCGCGLVMQPCLERCFPASLPAETRCELFFFCPLGFSPCRVLPRSVKDGAPDDPPHSALPLCRMSALGVRRGFTERTESHREGGWWDLPHFFALISQSVSFPPCAIASYSWRSAVRDTGAWTTRVAYSTSTHAHVRAQTCRGPAGGGKTETHLFMDI